MAIDVMHCYTTFPPSRTYIAPGLVPGTVAALVSPGGHGKSMFALQLAHCVAGGLDMLGLGMRFTGRAMYLSAEDSTDILHERLFAIGARLNSIQRQACASGLFIEDLTDTTPDLCKEHWRKAVEDAIRSCDIQLCIIDTLRSFHSSDENSAGDMSVLIGYLRAVAVRTDCAILFLHHSSKALAIQGNGDLQQASRGSSVLTDNIRWQGYLAGMTKEEVKSYDIKEEDRKLYVRFGVSKQNYGAPVADIWFKRTEGGVLVPVQLKTDREGSKDV